MEAITADRQKPIYAIRPVAAGEISLKLGETGKRHVSWQEENPHESLWER
jgi:hypothetical protein